MADGANPVFKFTLFIAAGEHNSLLALENVSALCRAHWPGSHEIELVDVSREPRRAFDEGIFVTPTLVKVDPAPVQRIIGSLSRAEHVLHVVTGGVPAMSSPGAPSISRDASEQIHGLIAGIHSAEQRIDDLTAGEVDAVMDPRSKTFLRRFVRHPLPHPQATRDTGILDALSKHVALLDPRGVIVSVNEAWRTFASSNDFPDPSCGVGSDYLDICDRAVAAGVDDPDILDAQRAATGIRSVLAGSANHFAMEYPCHSPREQRWFRMTVNPLSRERRDGVIVLHENVSERERAVLEKRQSAELLRGVLDGTTDNVFIKDVRGRYLLCNAAVTRNFGQTTEQMIGRDDAEIFGIESARPAMESDRIVLDTGSDFNGEYSLESVHGCRTYLVSKSPYRDVHGRVIGVIGISRDITLRKQVEEELSRSKSLLTMAGRLGRIGGWSLDLSDGRVLWSDETCAVLGVAPGTSPSFEQALAFYTPESSEVLRDAIYVCSCDGTPFDLELEVISPRGDSMCVRAAGEAVRGGDAEIIGVQGAFQDLSERKQSEREAQQLAKRLTTTLESITDAFYMVDRRWRFTYLNGHAERMFLRPREQLLGTVLWDSFPRLLGSEFARGYRRAMDEGTVVTVESYAPEFDAWFLATAYPSEEGIAIDVRRTSEERAARRHLELLEASVSQLKDIVIITDAAPPGGAALGSGSSTPRSRA